MEIEQLRKFDKGIGGLISAALCARAKYIDMRLSANATDTAKYALALCDTIEQQIQLIRENAETVLKEEA